MFVILQLLTSLMEGKWDAWHQFTVINPLRFLGLLEDAGDQEKDRDENPLKIEFGKLTEYKDRLIEYLNNLTKDDEIIHGAFVNHPEYGWCFVKEYKKAGKQYFHIFKMSDVQAEINRQIFEKANELRR